MIGDTSSTWSLAEQLGANSLVIETRLGSWTCFLLTLFVQRWRVIRQEAVPEVVRRVQQTRGRGGGQEVTELGPGTRGPRDAT